MLITFINLYILAIVSKKDSNIKIYPKPYNYFNTAILNNLIKELMNIYFYLFFYTNHS